MGRETSVTTRIAILTLTLNVSIVDALKEL
jgi:hypothetical protein